MTTYFDFIFSPNKGHFQAIFDKLRQFLGQFSAIDNGNIEYARFSPEGEMQIQIRVLFESKSEY